MLRGKAHGTGVFGQIVEAQVSSVTDEYAEDSSAVRKIADLLLQLDDRPQAAALAQEIVDDLDNSPAYIQRQNRRWRAAAKKLFKRATAASRSGAATNET